MPNQSNTLHLAAELRTVVSRLIKKLRTHSQMHSPLSLTERAVVKLLSQRGQMLPSELAAQEKVTTQSMSQILSHLSELGYITRESSATDKRKVLIALSAAGQVFVSNVQQETDAWLQQALQTACSAEELANLRQALTTLTKLVDFE